MATIGTKDFGHYGGVATNQGFYKYYFNAGGTKISGHYREGGRSSGVAIKWGSTVAISMRALWLFQQKYERRFTVMYTCV